MTIKSIIKSVHAFERKAYLGVTALAGAGAAATVGKWQAGWAEMAVTRDEFIATTGLDQVSVTAYENVSAALDNLKVMVGSGGAEAIHDAASKFYIALAENHAMIEQLLPKEVRGTDKPEGTTARVIELAGKALGLN